MRHVDFDGSEKFADSRDVIATVDEVESDIEMTKDCITETEEEIEDLRGEIDELESSEEPVLVEMDEKLKKVEALEKNLKEYEEELEELEDRLEDLKDFVEDLEGYGDWNCSETLIREDAIDEYLKDEAKDCGGFPDDFPSWITIDWDDTIDNLKQDYTSAEFQGTEYWMRV